VDGVHGVGRDDPLAAAEASAWLTSAVAVSTSRTDPQPGARQPMSPSRMVSLQRLAGNAAVAAMVRRARTAGAAPQPSVQRDDAPAVPVTGVVLSDRKVTIPFESGLRVKASVRPTTVTGAMFTVEKGSVEPSGVTINGTSGEITVASGQTGGTISVKATGTDGSWATAPLLLIEKPTGIASTAASSAGGSQYGGKFTHTLAAPSGSSSGLAEGNINERFDSLSAATPFGRPFTLSANTANSPGWALDSGGTMGGPDNVTIDKAGIDIGRFTKSASNPSAAALPQGFTMTQHLHAKSFPSGKLETTPFTDASHTRTLNADTKFVVSAGKGQATDDYAGPPAYTNAVATPPSVSASPAKPKAQKGAAPPAWNRNTSQVTADAVPDGATKVFAIRGPALGCEIDAQSGLVLIGDRSGTITVRVSSGRGANFDEATITITAPSTATTP
jgi:hypothetical protein